MATKSTRQYDEIIKNCKKEFLEKNKKYGQSISYYRSMDILQKIFIKLQRIVTIQEAGEYKVVGEPIATEFPGIINYCLYGIVLAKQITSETGTLLYEGEVLEREYDIAAAHVKSIFEKKNHDYGEAWRDLTISFMVKECLVKFFRMKTIFYSKKFDTNKQELQDSFLEVFSDISNYSIFCAILISEGVSEMV
jgi:hypothetical protein